MISNDAPSQDDIEGFKFYAAEDSSNVDIGADGTPWIIEWLTAMDSSSGSSKVRELRRLIDSLEEL